MKLTERKRRARRFDRICRVIQVPFAADVVKLKNNFIDQQCEHWSRYSGLSPELTHTLATDLDRVFFKYQSRVIRLIVEEVTLQLSKLNRKGSKWEWYLRIWVTAQGGRMVKEVANTTFNDLNTLLMAAFTEGQDETAVVTAGLRAKELSAWRADTIARTELHNAATFAAESTARDIGTEIGVKLVKIWQPVMDARTRADHAAMAGKDPIGMDEKFRVGGVQMSRPGDLNAPPEQVINCRCICLYDTLEE
jgi:hypothetical protein